MNGVLRRGLLRLLAALRPGRAERELARELDAHLVLLEDDYRRQGMSAEEARLAARRAMGGVEQAKELHRDARSWGWLEDARRDVGYAARALWRHRGFAAVTILTIALGIGATSAVFSVVKGVLLTPLPFTDPDRLVRIVENVPAEESFRGVAIRLPAMTPDEFEWWRTRATTLSQMAVTVPQPHTLRTRDGNVRLAGARVSPALFAMRGIVPLAGRGLVADEERSGSDVVVLSAETWRRYFAADPGVINQVAFLDERAHTVVGVMPSEFGGEDFWTPYTLEPPRPGSVTLVPATARLAEGVSLAAASAEINALGHQLRESAPVAGGPPRFELIRVQDDMVGRIAPALRVLVVAVGVVLLIVCANVANLLLTRGARRHHEVAVRRALGAARGRIIRQLLTESMVLALAGGVAGIGLGYAGVELLKALAAVELPAGFGQGLGPALLPRIGEIAVDTTVLAFSLAVSLLAGLLFGVLPALRWSGGRAARLAGAATVSAGTRAGHTLAVVQLTLATALLVGAGLLMHSFVKLTSSDLGFDPGEVLSFDLVLPGHYTAERKLEIAEALASRLASIRGVTAAGFTDGPPLSNRTARPYGAFTPPIKESSPPAGQEDIDQRLVSTGYLRALGARLVAGRWLEDDDRIRRPAPILVSQSYARYYFGATPAVGAILSTRSGPAVVAGVVGDVRFNGLDEPPPLVGFVDPLLPLEQNNRMLAERGRQRGAEGNRLFLTGFNGTLAYAVRVNGNPLGVVRDVRRVVTGIDPAAAIDSVMPLERVVGGTIAQPRFYAVIVGIFAALSAALAAIGVYGVLAYAVAQRTREIGIRMALGAQHGEVLALVMRQGGVLLAIGLGAGLAMAAGLTRYLDGMLFGLTPLDGPTYAAVATGFAVIALLASYLPARRATQVNPLIALRFD